MKRQDLGGFGGRRIASLHGGRSKRRRPLIEFLEQRTVMTAIPVASLTLPAQALLGETLNFTVGFSDASPTDPGFGPYVDLFLPTTGIDGAKSAPSDGIAFSSAAFLGSAVTSKVLTFDAAGHATHPYAKDNTGTPVVVSGTPGDELVVLRLPFGSFTPGQPTATIDVAAKLSNLANVGTPLNIGARGGFQFGNDALDNPTTDPTVIGGTTTSSIHPGLMILKTTYLGPEDETATGPNFPRHYLVSLDVATGQTLTNVDLTDVLPSNLQFVSVDATTIRGVSTSTTALNTPSTSTPGGTITRRFASVTGTTATDDATLLFTYYVPQLDAVGNPVLNPATGAPSTSIDDARAQANWTPIDPRNPATVVVSDVTPNDHTLIDRSLATQETVAVVKDTGAPGPSPGDTLEYTIQFQVSDYFAFQNLRVSNLISDGQHVDPTFTPTLQVNGNPFVLGTGGFDSANYTVSQKFTGAVASAPVFVVDPGTPDGTSTVDFRISDQMVTSGQNGQLLGGLVPSGGGAIRSAPGDGPTTGTIVFRTVIQDKFTDNFPSGENNVDHGDHLDSHVAASGIVLANSNLSPTANTVIDTSAASVSIVTGSLTHSIYAINGSTSFSSPAVIAAGDAVTYRVTYTLPTSDEEQLALSDFLPLPIFDATTVTSFDDVGAFGGTATIPTAGHANFGPGDTFRPLSGVVPAVSRPAATNSLKFQYPNFKDPSNRSSTIDLLFTIQASSQPFADGLFLTSQAHVVEGTTNAGPKLQDQIIQLKLTEPVLKIAKGIVSTDDAHAVLAPAVVGPVSFSAPGTPGFRGSATISSQSLATHSINSNVSKIDAGDIVSFAIVVENTGSGLNGAFNVRVRDSLPAGFVIPGTGLNLSVTDGTGTVDSFTSLGAGLFDAAGGLQVTDSGTTGAVAPYSATSGRNLLVITYDLQATGAVTPNQSLTNMATLTNYASSPGGPDFTTGLSDTATARIANPTLTKVLTTTDQGFTAGSNLAIGEVGTYTVVVTIPEGMTPGAKLFDSLPSGLAIVSLDSITASAALSTSIGGGFASVLTSASVGVGGSSATFDFGTLTNTDRNNAVAETITVIYRAVALNVAGNSNGAIDNNAARFIYSGGSVSASAPITIVTPLLQVVKSVDKATADAGDTVTYTLVLSHAAGSAADSFNVNLTDALPAGLSYVAESLGNTAGVAPTSLTESGGTISATFASFPLTSTSTITFQAMIGGGVGAFQTLTNTASVVYTSLASAVSSPASSYNAVSTERTGNPADPGGSANNLLGSGSAVVTVQTPPLAKVILGTSQAFTTGNNVAIGEEVQYQLTVTIPEGTTPNASVVDTLPTGLAIVSLDSIATSVALGTSVAGGFAAVLSGAAVGAGGSSATFDFGTLTDSDRNNATAETIVLTYTVVVLNSPGNHSGTTLKNFATFATPLGSTTTSAPAVTVVEPVLQVVKTPSSSTGDAGGPAVTFTIVVSHGAASNADAFDVNLSDAIPSGFTFVAGSLSNSAGLVPSSLSVAGGTISASYATFAFGSTSTLQFRATLNGTTSPGQSITNTASLTYTSLPGNVTTAESTYNPLSTERTGNPNDPGGASNNEAASGSGTVTVNSNTVGGFVYVDADNNGAKNAAEPAISGVTVTLGGTDNLGNIVTATTATSASGAYNFTALRPGSYSVSESQPSGYLQGKDSVGTPFGGSASTQDIFTGVTIPLGTNAAGASYLFGEQSPASVSGIVFSDANNDGAKQAGESGIAGASVTLSGADDLGQIVSTTATTNAAGSFSFTNLRPGSYSVTEAQPPAYLDGKDSAGNSGGTLSNDWISNFPLVGGQAVTGISFGELAPAGLAGSVYLDANNDGTKQAGEAGIGEVAVYLSGTDDLGNTVNVIVTTSNGLYGFSNLRPGTYAITKTPPSGYLDGKDAAGTPGGSTVTPNVISGIALSAGVAGTANNFGELLPSGLAGFVYVDANNDGSKSVGEAGISGVAISLTGTDDQGTGVAQSATTAADGSYGFTGLRPGTYAIAETQPGVYLDGKDAVGSQGGTGTNDRVSAIKLGEGVNGTGNNFGELTPASLAGVVYADANNDGTKQAAEAGIAGVTIALTGTDDLGNVVLSTTTTAVDGSYAFAALRPGSYTLHETQPAAFLDGKDAAGSLGGTKTNDNFAAIAVGVGENGSGYNFGELAPASLAGVVYSDINNDGIPQVGELGIAGVSVTLSGTDDLGNVVNLSASTAADGSYNFANLRPGSYAIAETQPAAYLDGKDSVGTQGGSIATNDHVSGIALMAGVAGTANNFGELAAASLAGIVYIDANNDGVKQAAEAGIAGVTVALTGVDDLGIPINTSTTTAADGSYRFPNLRPGTYSLAETQPAAYLDGKDSVGTQGGVLGNDLFSSIVLSSNTQGTANSFGELSPASIGGSVFNDLNDDGARDPAEVGIGGVTITLTGTDDLSKPVTIAATTAADGTYSFTGLRPGLYAVAESQPAAFADGPDSAGNSGGTLANDLVSKITIASGTIDTGLTFGEITLSSLAGLVYVDADDDGVKQPGEPGIAGATITLSGTDDLGQAVQTATLTAADGSYQFANLRPGLYTLSETQPSSYLDGLDSLGTTGGTLANDRARNIILPAATAGAAYDFGELVASSLGGSVYVDADKNGARGAGEPPISGVAVNLAGTDDLGNPAHLATTTALDGTYLFSGLRPGLYQVAETQPSAYSQGLNAVGTAGGVLGSDVIGKIGLSSGTSASGYTFGEQGTTLAGTVFFDAADSGKQDPGDPGMGGITITLLDAVGNVVAATTTAANGAYEFQNLPAGSYTIEETKPRTLLGTTPTVVRMTLPASGLASQDFGLTTGSLAGSVYLDSNDDGVRSDNESGIPNVLVTLTGTDLAGKPVSRATTTAPDGAYRFDGLLAGTYSLAETRPVGIFDGLTTAGNLGGTVTSDRVTGIILTPGAVGTGNNFAGLTPSSLAGFAYLDLHRDGVDDAGDVGIAHVAITLSGTDDLGNATSITTITQDDGSYQFHGLRPGRYTIADLQPKTFKDAADNVGSQGGRATGGVLSNLILRAGVAGTANNFGELPKPGCKLQVFVPYGANSVSYLNHRRGLDPARFDHFHPQLGPFLAKGGNPAAHVRFSAGPAIRHWLPTLGRPSAAAPTAAIASHPSGPMDRWMHRSGPRE